MTNTKPIIRGALSADTKYRLLYERQLLELGVYDPREYDKRVRGIFRDHNNGVRI